MSFSSEAISLIEYMASKFGIMIDWSNQNVLPRNSDTCWKIYYMGNIHIDCMDCANYNL